MNDDLMHTMTRTLRTLIFFFPRHLQRIYSKPSQLAPPSSPFHTITPCSTITMSIKLLRPSTLRPLTTRLPFTHNHNRTFFTSEPAELTASRTLNFPAIRIFDIIADINSYPKFLPYCQSAKVTSYSAEDAHYKRKWPHQAVLKIGYGDRIQESYTSRVYCVPPVSEAGRAGMGYVEAISGDAKTQLQQDHIEHHVEAQKKPGGESGGSVSDSPMEYLRTRWTVRAYPFKPSPEHKEGQKSEDGSMEATERCDVTLNIQYKFKNPAYDLMSKAVAPKMADTMIEAFEKRVQQLLK